MMTFLMTAVTLIWKRILMHQVATATIQTTQSQKSGEVRSRENENKNVLSRNLLIETKTIVGIRKRNCSCWDWYKVILWQNCG